MYGSSGQSFGWPSGAGLQVSAILRESASTHASQRLGNAARSPPNALATFTLLTDRHPLHCRCSSVARLEICEALMTIPGSRTRVVRVLAVRSRNWSRFIPDRRVTCIEGTGCSSLSGAVVGLSSDLASLVKAPSSWDQLSMKELYALTDERDHLPRLLLYFLAELFVPYTQIPQVDF